MRDFKIIILMGRSGCGKGTQAKRLQADLNFAYLVTGDLLRKRAEKNDFSGKKLKSILENGGRVPTAFMFPVWSRQVNRLRKEIKAGGLIVDGSPRSRIEAELMDEVFAWYGWPSAQPILLNISEETALNRLTKRGRADDKPEAMRARLDFYNRDVQPAVDYYQKQERLISIDGEQSIEAIHQEIYDYYQKSIGN